jgi:hypothetical protein
MTDPEVENGRGERMIPARPTPACIRYVYELGHRDFEARLWFSAIEWWVLCFELVDQLGIPQPETLVRFIDQATAAREAGNDARAARCALVAATNALTQLGLLVED